MTESVLLVLVGSNPLPNFLTVRALAVDRVSLVYTRETAGAKDRLRSVLSAADPSIRFEPPPLVEDASCAQTVRRTVEREIGRLRKALAPVDILLSYTGGTKVMAAHARLAFHLAGEPAGRASYLDEGGPKRPPCLRFDDGKTRLLDEVTGAGFDLTSLLALHDLRPSEGRIFEPSPTPSDAAALFGAVVGDAHFPGLGETLYSVAKTMERAKRPSDLPQVFRGADYGLDLSLPVFPLEDHYRELANGAERKAWFKRWYGFLGGGWFESWVAEQIGSLGLVPAPSVSVNVQAFRGPGAPGPGAAQLEVDVAVIRGHRSYFISCTTAEDKATCKWKLFEIAVRARHLGGDLARAALVCLANEEVTADLGRNVEEVWGGRTSTRVFGRDDVLAWSSLGGRTPNLKSLRDWLEN